MFIFRLALYLVTIVALPIGIAILRGKTSLIHEYHQKNVKDRRAYGKAIGKATILLSALSLVSALTDYVLFDGISIAIFVIGFIIWFAIIMKIQKKYNGGLFS